MKFESLEAFRGFAAIMIVLLHSVFYTDSSTLRILLNSSLFVDFFFVLSGFVMAYAYFDKIGNSINFRKYFLLRFGRLFPLHMFILFLWVPYIGIKVYFYSNGIGSTDPLETNNFYSFISNIFLIHALGVHEYNTWNTPSWSISTEFYTYIIFFIVTISFSGIKNIFIPLSLSLLAYIILYNSSNGVFATYDYAIFRCVGGFFSGVVVYQLFANFKKPELNNSLYATTIEIIALGLMLYFITNANESILFICLSILSFMIVIYVFSIQDIGLLSKALKLNGPQFIGKLSYSIYMTHVLILSVISNIFEYILKYESTSFEGVDKALVIDWANYLNFTLLLIVLFFSNLTYKYIEIPWRDKFRRIANSYS